jgi:two-component system chemotaxis response regulator CheY
VMPVLDGGEFIHMIRNPKSRYNPQVPIILLTGHSEKRRVIQARDMGVNEFLCKPISAKALYDRIASIVLHPRPFIETEDYYGPERLGRHPHGARQ